MDELLEDQLMKFRDAPKTTGVVTPDFISTKGRRASRDEFIGRTIRRIGLARDFVREYTRDA